MVPSKVLALVSLRRSPPVFSKVKLLAPSSITLEIVKSPPAQAAILAFDAKVMAPESVDVPVEYQFDLCKAPSLDPSLSRQPNPAMDILFAIVIFPAPMSNCPPSSTVTSGRFELRFDWLRTAKRALSIMMEELASNVLMPLN